LTHTKFGNESPADPTSANKPHAAPPSHILIDLTSNLLAKIREQINKGQVFMLLLFRSLKNTLTTAASPHCAPEN
jgi:hypothetical protein